MQPRAAENALPIDIDYGKCLSWLVDHRHVPRNWHLQLKAARSLSRSAWSETPGEIRSVLSLPDELAVHEALTYPQVVQTYRQLTADGVPEQWGSTQLDLLGRHVDPIRRAWKNALVAFEKSHVFLADLAQAITRNVDVEAPALRATITKLSADAADLGRKEGPALRAVNDATDRLKSTCVQYNISPDVSPRDNFHGLVSDHVSTRVPQLLTIAAESLKDLHPIVQFYARFAHFVARPTAQIASENDLVSEEVCPTLSLVFDSRLEALTSPTTRDVSPALNNDPSATKHAPDLDPTSINADNTTIGPEIGNENPDIAHGGTGLSTEAIDWSIEVAGEGVSTAVKQKVDLDESSSIPASKINWDITPVEDVGKEDQQARRHQETSNVTLADRNVRRMVLNDVYELRAFLDSRTRDMERVQKAHVALSVQMRSTMGPELGDVTIESLHMFREKVDRAIVNLTAQEVRHLLGMYDLPRAMDRAANEVRDKRLAVDRLCNSVGLLRSRRARILKDVAEESGKFAKLTRDTWQMVQTLEQKLATLYNGRDVHIVGEIHNSLGPAKT